jgi:hypothetical protein
MDTAVTKDVGRYVCASMTQYSDQILSAQIRLRKGKVWGEVG